jgi:glutamine synthetase
MSGHDESLTTLRGTFVDSAGVLRAKQVPMEHAEVFADGGLGASPVFSTFTADDQVAASPGIGPVGDLRLRADLEAAVPLGGGILWAPTDLVDQDGEPVAACPRSALRRQLALASSAGLEVRTGIEVEFVLYEEATGRPMPSQAYGLSSLDAHEALVDDLMASLADVGLTPEQLHAEYGPGRFEVSFGPADPLATADANVLARIVISTAARRHGCVASFSPKHSLDDVGTGAHHHLSLAADGVPLLSGGTGPHGLTPSGEAVIASLVHHLPEILGGLAPSAPSALRLAPESWSGAFACWGLENREAAVRLCEATHGNHHGAHLEVKVIDPSANVYVAGALLLGTARIGMATPLALPAEVGVDPGTLSAEELGRLGVQPLGQGLAATIDAFATSGLAAEILGEGLLAPLVAVRRHEVGLLDELGPQAVVERLRFVWSA